MANRFKAFTAGAVCLGLGTLFYCSRGCAAAGPETAPTTAPTTAPAEVPLTVTPEVSKILDEVNDAYAALTSLELAGTLTEDIDAGGQKHNEAENFTASFLAPNKFRHTMQDGLILGSTGQKVYADLKVKNSFVSIEASPERAEIEDLPRPVPQLLQMQNISMMLAVIRHARDELTDGVMTIKVEPDTMLNGKAYQTLFFGYRDLATMRLLIDQQTHLVRRAITDVRTSLEAKGTPDVKTAAYTVDYATVKPNVALNSDQFAWTAPTGARDLVAEEHLADLERYPAMALVGKPAPSFKLEGLDGKTVALESLKGSVVVLDFWATWCSPCVKGLPRLNKIYDEQMGRGLKVFAINTGDTDEPEKIRKFVADIKLTIPVLVDTKQDASKEYLPEVIPQTVLIGKDGKVLKVLIGSAPGNERALKDGINAALK